MLDWSHLQTVVKIETCITDKTTGPWLRRPRGMVVIQLLRRIMYNLLSLYRSVTTSSESKRQRSWTDLLPRLYASLLQATLEVMAGVRRRGIARS